MRPYYVYRFEGSVLVSLYVHGCAIIFFLCRYSTIQQRVCFCLLGNLIAYELKEMERDGWELWQWCEKEVDMIHDLQRKLMVRIVLHRPASHSFHSLWLPGEDSRYKAEQGWECAPYSCSSLSGRSSSPHHARCFHRCSVTGWRGLSVHGGLSSIFLFITDGRLQGAKVQSPALFSSFYSQLDELILIYLHACPGGLRLPSILFLSHILPRGS